MTFICKIERFENRAEECATIEVPAHNVDAVSAYLRALWAAGQIDDFYFFVS